MSLQPDDVNLNRVCGKDFKYRKYENTLFNFFFNKNVFFKITRTAVSDIVYLQDITIVLNY